MRAHRRTAVELAAVAGALALLFGASLLAARLFVREPVPAPDVPDAVERALRPLLLRRIRLGETVLEDPTVEEALRAMTERLREAAGMRDPVQVIVLDSPTVNALSLPGGLIVVYSGLMKRLDGAEQMAAILAHEMGHGAHRDSFHLLVRQLGLSAAASVLSGGDGESLAQAVLRQAVNLRYSREAEDRADAYALEILPAAGVDPAAFADALRRIRDSADGTRAGILRYLDAHEDVGTRIRRAEEASRAARGSAGFTARPLGVDWASLRARLPSALEGRP